MEEEASGDLKEMVMGVARSLGVTAGLTLRKKGWRKVLWKNGKG